MAQDAIRFSLFDIYSDMHLGAGAGRPRYTAPAAVILLSDACGPSIRRQRCAHRLTGDRDHPVASAGELEYASLGVRPAGRM